MRRVGGYWIFTLFRALLAELGFEVWIGDPAVIKTKHVKKHKTDREDPDCRCD